MISLCYWPATSDGQPKTSELPRTVGASSCAPRGRSSRSAAQPSPIRAAQRSDATAASASAAAASRAGRSPRVCWTRARRYAHSARRERPPLLFKRDSARERSGNTRRRSRAAACFVEGAASSCAIVARAVSSQSCAHCASAPAPRMFGVAAWRSLKVALAPPRSSMDSASANVASGASAPAADGAAPSAEAETASACARRAWAWAGAGARAVA
mmetsp:Transcript_13431/g.34275  ORF Transcript_13431/g.34275 Transcript_13431/m.34275 type:complete len:214 (-) Transcript_13431:495-1136(-)